MRPSIADQEAQEYGSHMMWSEFLGAGGITGGYPWKEGPLPHNPHGGLWFEVTNGMGEMMTNCMKRIKSQYGIIAVGGDLPTIGADDGW